MSTTFRSGRLEAARGREPLPLRIHGLMTAQPLSALEGLQPPPPRVRREAPQPILLGRLNLPDQMAGRGMWAVVAAVEVRRPGQLRLAALERPVALRMAGAVAAEARRGMPVPGAHPAMAAMAAMVRVVLEREEPEAA